MKKIQVLLPLLFLMTACGLKAAEPLSSLDPDNPSVSDVTGETYTAKLTRDNSGLTTDDSTEEITANIASSQDSDVSYSFVIGAPCYQHANFNEFIVKHGGYIKSGSSYYVDRIIVDFWVTKGVNFSVYAGGDASGDALEYHESSVKTEDPDDGGCVYEYEIKGYEWYLVNDTSYKPGFYSITVVFVVEE